MEVFLVFESRISKMDVGVYGPPGGPVGRTPLSSFLPLAFGLSRSDYLPIIHGDACTESSFCSDDRPI